MANRALHIVKGLCGNLFRFILAFVFLFSGLSKAIDPHGTEYKIGDYLVSFGLEGWYPDIFPLFLGMLLAAFEFYIGLCLLFGMNRKFASWASLLVMCIMTPLTLYIAIANPVSDCGCFGDVLKISNWQTFVKNVVLLLCAASLARWHNYRVFRLIGQNTQWLISFYGWLFVFSLELYSLYYLPIADFTPYAIGVNILEGMSVPEGAEQPQYESTFILEKNGIKKEFTLADYPDTTWTYVDTKTVLIKDGYVPPIHDFVLQDMETGEDVTDSILTHVGYTFLLVAYDLSKAGQGSFDQVNELYDYCLKYDYGFLALTASGMEDIDRWKYHTGAEYPFLNADGTMLKTLVRSNPGLILLKDGVIVNKWSRNDLPTYLIDGRIEDIPNEGETQASRFGGVVFLFLALPLMVIVLFDRVWAGFKLIGIIRRKIKIANLLKEKKK